VFFPLNTGFLSTVHNDLPGRGFVRAHHPVRADAPPGYKQDAYATSGGAMLRDGAIVGGEPLAAPWALQATPLQAYKQDAYVWRRHAVE